MSKISLLPDDVRAELDRLLVASGYGELHQAAAWLRERGHDIGKSAVGVYAAQLKRDRWLSDAAARHSLTPAELATLRMQAISTAWTLRGMSAKPDGVTRHADFLLAYALRDFAGIDAYNDRAGADD